MYYFTFQAILSAMTVETLNTDSPWTSQVNYNVNCGSCQVNMSCVKKKSPNILLFRKDFIMSKGLF